jgi:hypothetical protein
MKPICRNIQTNDLYAYQGGNSFKNLRTGVTGELEEEKAREFLKVNMEATTILNEYPIVQDLIQQLNLKMEKPKANDQDRNNK